MRRGGGNGKWAMLALGVAVLHFMAEFVSLFANVRGAASAEPDNWRAKAARQLFEPLSFPLGWLFRSSWIQAHIDGYVLLSVNSLLWGAVFAFVVRWLVAQRANPTRTRGNL